tara:strand:+ start:286 stop:1131 length:846 start_codon:yes stop_codon:yes gene_type:complete
MGKYFNVEVKPTISAVIQETDVFADGDLLFDWTAFNIPKGSARLVGATATMRGLNAADQDTKDFSIVFAKSINGVAPTTLGDLQAAVDTHDGNWFNNIIGGTYFDASHGSQDGGLVYMGVYSNSRLNSNGDLIVLEGEPNSGINVGYDKLYVAGIAQGEIGFSTNVETSQIVDVSGLSAAQLVNADIDGTDPRQVFAVGDIIHAEDGIILGEIESMADANTITFKTDGSKQYHANGEVLFTNPNGLANWKIQNGAGAAGDLANNDELYNIHPIKLILHFER